MAISLDNVFWHALSGHQAGCAVGTPHARRYAPGFSPIIAFADRSQPRFDELAPFCEPGEHLYCDGWTGPVPAGWHIETQAHMDKMRWSGPPPDQDEAPEAQPILPAHLPLVLELTALTHPGPFGPRTPELGAYFGLFENGRLMAMAGERAHAGSWREISGVCTHPDFQGRGLAKRLMRKLIRQQMQRQETPFLHVMCDNVAAHTMYLRMGFEVQQTSVVRVVSRRPFPAAPMGGGAMSRHRV